MGQRAHALRAEQLHGAGWTVADDPRIERETRLRDLLALFDVLHIERAHLVAHDMGVITAMQLTYDHPSGFERQCNSPCRRAS
jgi:pimeloyl-ACP methyl ester carboxylesterase